MSQSVDQRQAPVTTRPSYCVKSRVAPNHIQECGNVKGSADLIVMKLKYLRMFTGSKHEHISLPPRSGERKARTSGNDTEMTFATNHVERRAKGEVDGAAV